MASRAQLHAELIRFLRQHCPVCDERHLVLLGWMVAGLLLSETVCFDHWKTKLGPPEKSQIHCGAMDVSSFLG